MARAGKKNKSTAPSRRARSSAKKPSSKKPTSKVAAGKKPARKKDNKSKSAGKAAPRKAVAKKTPSVSKKSSSRAKKTTRPTAKTRKAPDARRLGADTSKVRARFTEPLRRFSPYENLRDLIRGRAEEHGDRTFLIYEDDGREYSFKSLDRYTTQVANTLHDLGLQKGARVALLLGNSPDFVFSFLGSMKGGFIAVPMNLSLSDQQIRFQLEDSGASVVIADSRNWTRVSALLQDLPGLQTVLLSGKTEVSDPPETDDAGYSVVDLHEAMQHAGDSSLKTSELGWWDEAQIVYTGQHLHQPRGAILQHRQFMTSARWLSIWLALEDNQRFMSVLPLFHVNAQVISLFAPLHLGGSVVLSREFGAARVWKAVERYRVTTLSAVPTMLGILADREFSEARAARPAKDTAWPAPAESPGTLAQRDDRQARDAGLARAHDISSLERVLCGAAPLPTAVQKRFEQAFLVPVIEGYSMAETTCFAMLNPGNGTRRLGSVGVAVGNKVAVLSRETPVKPLVDDWLPTALPRMAPTVFPTAEIGEPGEICVWGENVLKEYFRRPSINPETFAGGWFHTGDIGLQDADGYFYVSGPKREEISREGIKFMPREVDEVLFQHQQVEKVATVGLSGNRGGSMVTTFVVMRKGTFPDGPDEGRLPSSEQELEAKQQELQAFLSQHLSQRKRPTTLMFSRDLPSDHTGKTRVIDLRRLAGDSSPDEEE